MSETESPETELKILLVDDEVNITKALRRLLMDVDHYDIYTASSGAEALELLAEESGVGVIVSDQRMPEMTGVEFLQQARELVPDAVRILLTGYADVEASIAAINQGAVFRYLTKPWDDELLIQAIAEAARNYHLVAENKHLNALVLKQKDDLQEWNSRLKQRVLDQTSQIRSKGDELAKTNQQLKSGFEETIQALSEIIEMRDQSTPGHSRNVAELVTIMGSKLGLPEEECKKIRSAGLLHDIGKIALPEKMLKKSFHELDEKELRQYQSHSVRGQTAIDKVPVLRDIGILIRHHHEHFDGGGFPDQLQGDAIPLGSRIICAADMFERKVTQFPEGEALRSALKEIEKEWGNSLDPELKTALIEGANEVFQFLDLSAEKREVKISPKELEKGMQLLNDLHTGTGILLLKKGAIFDDSAIDAVKRCHMIDPFEREIAVLLPRQNTD